MQGCKEEWDLSTFAIGVIGAFYPLGLLIGVFFWGIISDKYGRMHAFKNTVLVAAISSLFLVLAFNYYIVCVCLFLLGIGIAGEISIAGTVFMEFCPPTKRYYLTLMSLFLGIGATTIALIALIVSLFNDTTLNDWRYIVGFGFICEAISLFFRYFMKETPAYYVMKGDFEKAEKILNMISLKNNNKEFRFDEHSDQSALYEFSGSSLINNEKNPSQVIKKIPKLLCKQLHNWRILKAIIVISTVIHKKISFTASFSYTGFIAFMPEFLKNFSTTEAYGIIAFQQFCGFPGVIFGTWLVQTRMGRKSSGSIFFIFGGICFFGFFLEWSLILVK